VSGTDLTLPDVTMADLIADAAMVRLPTPRTATAARAIDLRIPAPRPLEIPAATIDLVEGYADSHL
jgi:hypothetical protein